MIMNTYDVDNDDDEKKQPCDRRCDLVQ